MQQKCEFCGSFINDTDKVCPNCGATNENVIRSAEGLPKTIQELKDYAAANNLPLKQMRFFIGEDFKEPKAFGIFEKDGVYTVYKNKADGSRAVRYRGTDETYAVNELYQKMHSEIMLRKEKMLNGNSKNLGKGEGLKKYPLRNTSCNRGCLSAIFPILVIIIIEVFSSMLSCGGSHSHTKPSYNSYSTGYRQYDCTPDYATKPQGYYNYNGQEYYYRNNYWFLYDSVYGWKPVYPDYELRTHNADYYDGYSYSYNGDYSDFTGSDYYYTTYSYSSGYNSSYNSNSWTSDWGNNDYWDSGSSWDFGDTDWSSDWKATADQ